MYCVQLRSPSYRKDVTKLERVENKFICMLSEVGGMNCGVRLELIGTIYFGAYAVEW